MEKLKLIITNLGLVVGSTITWIDTLDEVLRLIATVGTIVTIILTIEKLLKERK